MYQDGDIVLIPFPFTDLSNSKLRPAIVISSELVNSTQDIILLAITSNLRADDFSFLLRNEDLNMPMRLRSEVRCNKVFTASQRLIRKKINQLSPLQFQNLFNQFVRVLSS